MIFASRKTLVVAIGLLALLPAVDLGDVTGLRVAIEHPGSRERIELDCRIANQARCDDGVMAVGVRFDYELDRADEIHNLVQTLITKHPDFDPQEFVNSYPMGVGARHLFINGIEKAGLSK